MTLLLFLQLLIGSPKKRFIFKFCRSGNSLLDVGIANGSLSVARGCGYTGSYTGVDITEQPSGFYEDLNSEYLRLDSVNFAEQLGLILPQFDNIICSHTLEHCQNPLNIVDILLKKLRPGGHLYLSTPCAETLNFPKREGTLNFFDDPTHVSIVDVAPILDLVEAEGFSVVFTQLRYRPLLGFILGALAEPLSLMLGRCFGVTWYFYGFETIIVVRAGRGSDDE